MYMCERSTGTPLHCSSTVAKSAVTCISIGTSARPNGTMKNRNASGTISTRVARGPSAASTSAGTSATAANCSTTSTPLPRATIQASVHSGRGEHSEHGRCERRGGQCRALAPRQPQADRQDQQAVRKRVVAEPLLADGQQRGAIDDADRSQRNHQQQHQHGLSAVETLARLDETAHAAFTAARGEAVARWSTTASRRRHWPGRESRAPARTADGFDRGCAGPWR